MQKYPEAAEILFKKGMHCMGCEMAGFETLEQGCVMHGLNANKIVDEINKKISKTKSKRSKKIK
jgi:hydroxylamine reductase